tara:strand:- start:9262 stop:10242 length:981 start_codon:yes stop_codon:yes gene_type:complete
MPNNSLLSHQADMDGMVNYKINNELGQNLHWMHGLEEYLTYIKHPQCELYFEIKRAIMYGNIWHIKHCLRDEIRRGEIELTEDFLNILLAHYTGYEYVSHRKCLQYVAHCIDDDYVRKMSSWSIKWEDRANLNEHFSRGQMKSKCWLVEKLANVFPNAYLGTVAHYGGWYATVAKNIMNQFKVKRYYNIELDETCIDIADDFNYTEFTNNWQFKSIHANVDDIRYDENNTFTLGIKNRQKQVIKTNIKPDIIINTSCEHMDQTWFEQLPVGTLVCLQTNDYFSNEQHVNCCENLQAAMDKYPMREVLYSGEIDTHLYNRFMIIGEK